MTIIDNPKQPTEPDTPFGDEKISKTGDKVFFGLSFGAATLILVTLGAVALFLVKEGLPVFTASDKSDLERGGDSFFGYVGPLVLGTVYIATIALLIATPIAVAVAVYISHYAPKRLSQTLGYFIDLLAAIPSVVYGIWGITVLAPILSRTLYPWLDDYASWLPFFGSDVNVSTSGRTTLTVGIVLAVMVLPRSVLADPAAARRGLAGPRRNPLGDDPPSCAPVRSLGCDLRSDARPGPCARRDDGRRHDPVAGRRILLEHHYELELEHDRCEHRPAVPGVVGPGGQPTHRNRPGAVHHHLWGQCTRTSSCRHWIHWS